MILLHGLMEEALSFCKAAIGKVSCLSSYVIDPAFQYRLPRLKPLFGRFQSLCFSGFYEKLMCRAKISDGF